MFVMGNFLPTLGLAGLPASWPAWWRVLSVLAYFVAVALVMWGERFYAAHRVALLLTHRAEASGSSAAPKQEQHVRLLPNPGNEAGQMMADNARAVGIFGSHTGCCQVGERPEGGSGLAGHSEGGITLWVCSTSFAKPSAVV